MTKTKIAVYGTLRKGQGNHHIIKSGKYLGEFESKPIFKMFSIGTGFPGIVTGGTTSVTMEVYEVDETTEERVDSLEGYSKTNKEGNMYDKKKMITPYGEAYFYTYNGSNERFDTIKSGDWCDYKSRVIPLNSLVKS